MDENIVDIAPVDGNISRERKPYLSMDVEISADGNTMYYCDNEFGDGGGPNTSNIVIAKRVGDRFENLKNSDELMANINTELLEYAPAISEDELTFFFTRTDRQAIMAMQASSSNDIFVSTRRSVDEPFGEPRRLDLPSQFKEAVTIDRDGRSLYFHMMDRGKFRLFRTQPRQ
ncbi:MAG: hypothetical protein HKM24_03070 [Gammaproteobacteria bacterium]|nr:hypothetical protein [Gammaproteobacteria bacterium]